MRASSLIATAIVSLAGGISATFGQQLPAPIAIGQYRFAEVNLDDPRLDANNLRPLIDPILTPAEQKQTAALSDRLDDFVLQDPTLSPRVREVFRGLLQAYRAELRSHEKKYDPNRRVDPIFDAKVDAAGVVAREHIGKITGPRGGGILPAAKCTDLREYERAHWLAETTVQTLILKQKYNIDWAPPPQYPQLGPNAAAEIDRGIPMPPLPHSP